MSFQLTDDMMANAYQIGINYDDWLRDRFEHETRWIVELDNGLIVYQDDYRPTCKLECAWERLGIYCRECKHYITKMKIQFRSHTVGVGEGADGFFFCKTITGSFGGNSALGYIVGTLENNRLVKVTKWRVPELIEQPFLNDKMVNYRTIEECGICLITKPGIMYDSTKL